MNKLNSLSIFFPCLNDGQSLSNLVPKAFNTAGKFTKDIEIIIIDDGSTDDSLAELQKLSKKYPLQIISHKKTLGYGAALIDGFKHATKDWVFYTDGDWQYDPDELPKLVEKLTDTTDVVNGYKINRSDPIIRRLVGDLYNFGLHHIFPLPIYDIDCDFRLIKRSYLQKINLNSKSASICLELILKLSRANASFAQAGVHHYKRPYGNSKFFNLKNILETLFKDNIRLFLEFYSKDYPFLKPILKIINRLFPA
ncbi:MAG: Glycosyl transferase family 2 [Microgenomates group bacterium GW2011_GWA2_37_6]|nr:MAG: Glycosyl transferase family 2 [Microgenomates group bacterium GW2011_GWA2_37_6]